MYIDSFLIQLGGERIGEEWSSSFGSHLVAIHTKKKQNEKTKQAKRRERERNENNTLNISSYAVIANGMYLLFDSDCMNRTTFLPRIQFFLLLSLVYLLMDWHMKNGKEKQMLFTFEWLTSF